MKAIMVRKIIWGSFSVGANVAFGVTLACSALFPISVFAAPLVAGVRTLLALGKHHYEHAWLDYGLNRPEFLKL
jgi:hypothetical protein